MSDTVGRIVSLGPSRPSRQFVTHGPPSIVIEPADYRRVIEGAVRHARSHRAAATERWVAVRDALATDETLARALCHRFGLDPDAILLGCACDTCDAATRNG